MQLKIHIHFTSYITVTTVIEFSTNVRFTTTDQCQSKRSCTICCIASTSCACKITITLHYRPFDASVVSYEMCLMEHMFMNPLPIPIHMLYIINIIMYNTEVNIICVCFLCLWRKNWPHNNRPMVAFGSDLAAFGSDADGGFSWQLAKFFKRIYPTYWPNIINRWTAVKTGERFKLAQTCFAAAYAMGKPTPAARGYF